jgi:class 3 adenylate cyclase/CheY-like chemotaxis protein
MRERPLILVVDDLPDNIEIVRLRLESQVYDVIAAADGVEALEQVRAHSPDLILLDVMMPRMDGIETVKRLKADATLPFIPVVMLTAQSDREHLVAGLDAGADEYLTKPFDTNALLARVRAMLRIKALQDEVRVQAAQLAEWNLTLEQRVAAQLAEIRQLDWLKSFVAPRIAELVRSGGDGILRSHRRNVAVVFCDLRGYTAFAEVAEPEEQIAMLNAYHATLGALIDQFEGTLIQIVGDGIMVVFNDPIPCEDPGARAVHMAIEMRDRVGAFIAKWRTHGYDLGFGIGVSQGHATLGLIGSADRSQYTAVGTVTNLGARLCGEAANGQILVDSRIKAAIEALLETEDAGELTLKGLRRPIRAYNVVGPCGLDSKMATSASGDTGSIPKS